MVFSRSLFHAYSSLVLNFSPLLILYKIRDPSDLWVLPYYIIIREGIGCQNTGIYLIFQSVEYVNLAQVYHVIV